MITKAYVNRNIARLWVDILFTTWDKRLIKPIQFEVEKEKDQGALADATMCIPENVAQSLLQGLWDAGFRPNDGEGSAGHVAALQAHIKFAERVADTLLPEAR